MITFIRAVCDCTNDYYNYAEKSVFFKKLAICYTKRCRKIKKNQKMKKKEKSRLIVKVASSLQIQHFLLQLSLITIKTLKLFWLLKRSTFSILIKRFFRNFKQQHYLNSSYKLSYTLCKYRRENINIEKLQFRIWAFNVTSQNDIIINLSYLWSLVILNSNFLGFEDLFDLVI